MTGLTITQGEGMDPTADDRILEQLGWRRRAECDEAAREAWELADGTILLLDPTGATDSIVRPPHERGQPAGERPGGDGERRVREERRADHSPGAGSTEPLTQS